MIHWQASHVPPLSMASMEQAIFSSAVKVLAPAAVAAVWVAMTPRCSFLTSMVGISLLVFSLKFLGKRKREKCRVSSESFYFE